MSPKFRKLLSENVGVALAKQLALADLLEQRPWAIDIGQGQVKFGDDLVFPIQLLGTESEGDGSWLWAWANKGSNFPQTVLKTCNELKVLGEQNAISELADRSYSTELANGHMLAMLASGKDSTSCYYRGGYDGGAVFFLVNQAPQEVIAAVTPERAITVISQAVSSFDIDPQLMVKSFLVSQQFEVSEGENSISADRAGNMITIDFDSHGRISNMQATLSNTSKPRSKKKGWQFWRK